MSTQKSGWLTSAYFVTITSLRLSHRFSTAIPLSAMYGYEVTSLEDPLVTIADKSLLMGTTLLTPGGSFINIFPFLRHVPAWFPGASSRRTADEVKRMTEWLIQNPLDWVKDKMVSYVPRIDSDESLIVCETGERFICSFSGVRCSWRTWRKGSYRGGRDYYQWYRFFYLCWLVISHFSRIHCSNPCAGGSDTVCSGATETNAVLTSF